MDKPVEFPWEKGPATSTYLIFGFWWRKASVAPWRCSRSRRTRPAPWQGREGEELSCKNQQRETRRATQRFVKYHRLHSVNIRNAAFLIVCLRSIRWLSVSDFVSNYKTSFEPAQPRSSFCNKEDKKTSWWKHYCYFSNTLYCYFRLENAS